MASHLFTCVKCLGRKRIVGYVPPDFDEICEDCKEEPVMAEAVETLKERLTRKKRATKPSWKVGETRELVAGTPLEKKKKK